MEIEKIDLHVIQNQGRWRELVSRPRAVGSACLAVGMDLLESSYYIVRSTEYIHTRARDCPIWSRFLKLSIYSAYLRCGD